MIPSKARLLLYTLGSITMLVIPVLVAFGALGQDQADSVGRLITALIGLFGAGASGTAAVVLGKQRKDGTLDTPPAPADAAVAAIQATVDQATTAAADLDRVKQAATDALGGVLGPLAQQVIEAARRL